MSSLMSPCASEPGCTLPDQRWQRLVSTAAAVRVEIPAGRRSAHPMVAHLFAALVIAGVGLSTAATLGQARPAAASATANSDLFALTNQDRSSNGVGSLQNNATLAGIAEGLPYAGCGFTVYGRAHDMVNRNYFAHPILGCGQLVFAMLQASGVRYTSAGENIGWDSGTTDPGASTQFINAAFMNSPEHRANILNRAFTHLGIGSAQSGQWSGAGGGPYSDVWLFSQEFAQLDAGTAVTTPAVRAATAPPPPPIRNDPAPPPPALPPLVTGAPPSPQVPPSATTSGPPVNPGPSAGKALPGPPSPPLAARPRGVLSDSIEAVLEAYLVD